MTRLQDLYDQFGQSPWIDDLRRSYVTEGGLQELVAQGVRGLTSNPTIMAKSIEAGNDYDAQFEQLIAKGASIEDVYWELVLFDARGALEILRPLYDSSGGGDGFVSVEVLPSLAHESAATEQAARDLHERIAHPNLLVKIPATVEGLPAIEAMIGEGRSINVTLIFSLERYDKVIDAYLSGLEHLVASGGDPSHVASVASFFVSRVDTEVDRRLDAIVAEGGPRAEQAASLKGTAALAQAKLAYALFQERFGSERFAALKAKGARVQRPLWASTSTKNPAYPDLLYVDGLIGPDTVNTMPDATVAAFLDHGTPARTVDQGVDAARAHLDALAELGISLDEVTALLETEGVASFAKSFDELTERLQEKAVALGAAEKG
ncbi:MAG TPA: transaldolase [Acidimicrobiales bacterium]|nr:transaldolase [Acidimicrobiales bacterium]